jgi:hypothetical protein
MSIKVDGIESEDELKKAQAAAQAQGTSVTNYSEWDKILKDFEEYGVESTGSYSGDKAKAQEIEKFVEEYIAEMQAQNENIQNAPQNNETEKVQEITQTDREQQLKASVANATSSQIMADYMKYYHMLM